MFRISYLQNGTLDTAKVKAYSIAHKTFNSKAEALDWVSNNAQITPIKLLVWDDEIDCFTTVREF
jgi:hypothetical protein